MALQKWGAKKGVQKHVAAGNTEQKMEATTLKNRFQPPNRPFGLQGSFLGSGTTRGSTTTQPQTKSMLCIWHTHSLQLVPDLPPLAVG